MVYVVFVLKYGEYVVDAISNQGRYVTAKETRRLSSHRPVASAKLVRTDARKLIHSKTRNSLTGGELLCERSTQTFSAELTLVQRSHMSRAEQHSSSLPG